MRTKRFTVSLAVPSREREARKHTHKYPIHLSRPPRASPDVAARRAARRAHRARSTPAHPSARPPQAFVASPRRCDAYDARASTKTRDENISIARVASLIDDAPCSLRGAARKGGSRRRARVQSRGSQNPRRFTLVASSRDRPTAFLAFKRSSPLVSLARQSRAVRASPRAPTAPNARDARWNRSHVGV